jgi:hypothetical protein
MIKRNSIIWTYGQKQSQISDKGMVRWKDFFLKSLVKSFEDINVIDFFSMPKWKQVMLERLALFDLFSLGVLSTLSPLRFSSLSFRSQLFLIHPGDDQFMSLDIFILCCTLMSQIRYLAGYTQVYWSGKVLDTTAPICNYQQVYRTLHPFAFSSKHPADIRYLSGIVPNQQSCLACQVLENLVLRAERKSTNMSPSPLSSSMPTLELV